jgi:ATP-dependent exoDNAse (exonuclease V) alpha subunit/predicted SprT family Zn-dependent metalloprotease
MSTVSRERFEELLAKAKLRAAEKKQEAEEAGIAFIEEGIKKNNVDTVDFNGTNISNVSLRTDAGQETAADIIREIAANIATQKVGEDISRTSEQQPKIGVTRDIILNSQQQRFLDTVVIGDDCVLIGAAGTGKTTSMRRVTRALIDSERIGNLRDGTKWLIAGCPGAVVLSYTRKAVNNIRHAVVDELKPHTLTIHKLLEFAPMYYEIEDSNKPGEFKRTMRFEPQRNENNPLPVDLKFIAYEESSMISVELYNLLQKAMPQEFQEVFLGDIQQLPPTFGLAILGFKLLELPVIELTEIYRQALESPIIDLAWKILGGNPHYFSPRTETYKQFSDYLKKQVSKTRVPSLDELSRITSAGAVKFQIWQKPLSVDNALNTVVKQFTAWADQGYYNPDEDIILCPFNKAFGTIEINKGIMQHLGRKRNAKVYEIIAGFNKHYLAVGDRVLYDKEDCVITAININGEYLNTKPIPASVYLDRWGHYQKDPSAEELAQDIVDTVEIDVDKFMAAAIEQVEERVQAASHIIHLKYAYDEDLEVVLDKAAEINNLLGGYAITVHKAQGSEWEKVFFIMHNSHAIMNQRELLYTAVTRAKNFLHIICETDTFFRGVKSQRIKGDTLAEKAEFFKGKASEKEKELQPMGHLSLHHSGDKPKVTMISGKKAVKLADLVPLSTARKFQNEIEACWHIARQKFDDIGPMPILTFESIRNKKTVGRAYLRRNKIALNPVWCAVEDEEILSSITNETIPHEICHFIAWRLHKDNGHGKDWKLAMMKMGLLPSRFHTTSLPPWVELKQDLLKKVLLDVEEQPNDEEEQEVEV